MHINWEFKARCADPDRLEQILLQHNPEFRGTDHQVDTYFHSPNGRLKLREGNIENSLIHYERTDAADAKQSDVTLFETSPHSKLKALLQKALGIKVVIDKERKIYFIDNVKFHFDRVKGLGSFVEVEAIDKDGSIGIEKLKNQCIGYAKLLEIQQEDYMAESYSDMLLAKKSSTT
jgi:adenylate cyclase class 2